MIDKKENHLANIQAYLDECAANGIRLQKPPHDLTFWSKKELITHIESLEQTISDLYNEQN